jgi:hypothetical protein
MQSDPVNPQIHYEVIGGQSPAIAWGVYRAATFDFRARHDHWDFVLSPFPNFPAADISYLAWYDLELVQRSEKPFPEDMVQAFRNSFFREGEYGPRGGEDASYMPKSEIERIVRECIEEYDRLA